MLFSLKPVTDLARPVAVSALVVDASDFLEILLAQPGPLRGRLRIADNGGMKVNGRWADRHTTADRLAKHIGE